MEYDNINLENSYWIIIIILLDIFVCIFIPGDSLIV